MYTFTTTERNNAKANEYETKSMLYLFGCRKDSEEIEASIIDCFNDVTGSGNNAEKLWDVQAKGVKDMNPKKVGIALVTLFQNFLSDIDFEHYILFMPKLKEKYLLNGTLLVYGISNFNSIYVDKVRQGLSEEYERRNGIKASETDINAFFEKVEFVIADKNREEYIKKITSFKTSNSFEEKFYDSVFEEIRKKQMDLKSTNVHGIQIMKAEEVLQYEKIIWKKEIDALIINRMLGVDIFNSKTVLISFIDEIVSFDDEERKDILQECQADIARLLFDKNGRIIFWKFFSKLLAYKDEISQKKPRKIYEKLKYEGIVIPHVLGEMSVIYLISALKEGFTSDY